MAPSPELGQPKAPDKTSQSSTTGGNNVQSENFIKNNVNSESSVNLDSKMNNIIDNSHCTKNSKDHSHAPPATTSASAASSTSQSSSAGASSSQNTTHTITPTSNSLDSTNLKNWDDCNFRSLLDEAYRYRSPKDRENKSEIFLQLLQKAESKEEESEYLLRSLSSRYTQGSNRHKHGGSLQDLDKAAHHEVSLDVYGNRNHQHHHNSRPKKYSSVSSRQREGGSLPSNVNVSNCNLSICEQPFLNEESNKRRGKNERTCSGTSCTSGTSVTSSTVSTGHDSLSSGQAKDDTYTNSSGDTIIDMNDSYTDDTQHLLAHDSLAQGISEPLDCDEGTELSTLKKFPQRTTMSTSVSGKYECAHAESKHYVDESVTFPSLERGKSVEATYLNLDESYKACKSILGGKADIEKPPTTIFSNTRTNTKHFDENGNSLNSPYNSSQSQAKAKKKKPQSEKNTTTYDAQDVVGSRGKHTVEELLKFIENTDAKKNDKSFSANKKKEKKKEKDKDINKKEIHKVKKSNSLEELRSCTKLDEDEKPENQVTMRNKIKKVVSPNFTSDGKENLKQQNNKRGERRSWGTEELTYLGENNAIEEVREKAKEKEKKKSKETTEKHEKFEKSDNTKKKKDESSLSSTFMLTDLIHSESAEFHVVTKKKKAKKRQQSDDTRLGGGKSVSIKDSPGGSSAATHGHKKYQAGSNFTNDREAYLNSFNTGEPRRKSTSSVPPSEKSDSSDLDSVHSLPVESTSNRHHISGNLVTSTAGAATSASSGTMAAAIATAISSPQAQPQSYADIARTVNAGKYYSSITSPPIDKMDKWPSVSAYSSSNSSSGSGGNVNNTSFSTFSGSSEGQGATSKNYKKSLNRDFPYLVSDRGGSNNDAGSSCSSTSSNSTIVKQISYSQSLNDDKCATHVSGAKSPTATPGTKLTDVIKSNDIGRQTLQKSKSVESDNYYSNIDQYPALEKTVKRHTSQAAMHEIKSPNVMVNVPQSLSLATTLKQQQRSPSSVMPNLSSPPLENVGAAQHICDAKSKSATYSADVNYVPNAALSNLSCNANCNPNSKKTKQQQPHTNAKFTYSENAPIVAPSIVETNNAKNKQQQVVLSSAQQQQMLATDHLSSHNSIVNINRKLKPEAIALQQQTPVTNNPQGRKSKKDRINQISSSCSNAKSTCSSTDAAMTTTTMHTTNSSNSSSKISNRPAVIILNDISDSSLSIGNDFTFGDFNEEELRLFDTDQHHQQQLDDSANFSLSQSGQDAINTVSVDSTPRQQDEIIHLSPHSDQGYSSSNNRSILSESADSSLCVKSEVDQPTVPIGSAVINSDCNNDNIGICSTSRKLQSQMAVSVEMTPQVPNTATNLGTNFVVASAKVDLSCINSNSVSNHIELSYDPCIIAVNSIDINRNKSNIIYSSENSLQQQQRTQQLVNQILVNSSASSNTSNNNNNCNISTTSGMSSTNDNSPSLLLDSKISANSANSNDVSTTTTAISLAASEATATASVSPVIDNSPTAATTTITTSIDENENSPNSQKKFNKKDINIHFVPPPASSELNPVNFEKIVDFVGLAWEEILHGVNRGTQFYNGQ